MAHEKEQIQPHFAANAVRRIATWASFRKNILRSVEILNKHMSEEAHFSSLMYYVEAFVKFEGGNDIYVQFVGRDPNGKDLKFKKVMTYM